VTEPLRCAGALVVDDDGRIFFQRRSAQRRLFPNCWDIVGGHVENGETIEEALHREMQEETGWQISVILGLIGEYAYRGNDGIVRVDGDLGRPQLEVGKHTEYRWLTDADLDLLDEHHAADEGLIRQIAEDGFATLHAIGL
jgi:8-oxo-dGTP diphosphatase